MSALVYIHGFNGSGQSHKAGLLQRYIQAHQLDVEFFAPSLSHQPRIAIQQLDEILQRFPSASLVGSSLGGYYATYLVEKYGCLTSLINPAVKPYNLLKDFLGINVNSHTQEVYHVGQSHFDELFALDVAVTRDDRYLLMVETGDEILDYRLSVEKYAHSLQWVIEGGAHEFCAFERLIPKMLQFLGIPE